MVAVVAKQNSGKPGRKPGKPRVFDGAKLRAIRVAREGLTQAKLAEQVGVHEVDVSRYERGEVDPSLHTLVNLARVLEVEMKDLLKNE